jgi:diguanylate cyclase (GGDEF)-like protein
VDQILLVDDSRVLGASIKDKVERRLGLRVRWAPTFTEGQALIESDPNRFFVALLDLNLPDAPRGAIVDVALHYRIPSIVFSAELSERMRQNLLRRRIIDFIAKENPQNIEYAIGLVQRIYRNRWLKVLVVDDSWTARNWLYDLVKVHQYRVIDAPDGLEALRVLHRHPDIRLVITDFYMPRMDGFELTARIRSEFHKEELAIIGLSSYGDRALATRFIKNGANDFINKPIMPEELYTRLTQNIERIEYIHTIREASHRDYLTGLYNRRYFFETGQKLYASARRGHLNLALAMIDLDRFKSVNDRYGHEAGDIVLAAVARRLSQQLREADLVARLGGEEFAVLTVNMDPGYLIDKFELIRNDIAAEPITIPGHDLFVTVSVGLCDELADSLSGMVNAADRNLYTAKAWGRNQVVGPASESIGGSSAAADGHG